MTVHNLTNFSIKCSECNGRRDLKSNCNGIRYDKCQNTCQEYGLTSDVGNAFQCTAPTEERITSSSSSSGSSGTAETLGSMNSSGVGSTTSLNNQSEDNSVNDGISGVLNTVTNIGLTILFCIMSLE